MRRRILVKKDDSVDSHNDHRSNLEAVKALQISENLKRQAQEHDDRPPTVVLYKVHDTNKAVQAPLPEMNNIRRGVQRECLRLLPSNHRNIEELQGC